MAANTVEVKNSNYISGKWHYGKENAEMLGSTLSLCFLTTAICRMTYLQDSLCRLFLRAFNVAKTTKVIYIVQSS